MSALTLSDDARITAGVLLITIVTIEFGGWYMLKLVRGQAPATDFQKAFARAGHAHAGVLVMLALVCQLYVGVANLDGIVDFIAGKGVAVAAILMPSGFFFSSMGKGVTRPNPLIWLIYAGAACLGAGVLTLGIGLL
jgi:hypothetical protein